MEIQLKLLLLQLQFPILKHLKNLQKTREFKEICNNYAKMTEWEQKLLDI